MSLFYKLYRATKVIAHFSYASAELVITRPRTRAARAAWLGTFCGRVLRSMEITYDIVGPMPMSGAIISNHLT